MQKTELKSFLVKAKRATYASGDASSKIVEPDKSTSLAFVDGDWKYHDNYFGGEPFGGREVAFCKNQPVYMMTYYGWVDEKVRDFQGVYGVLQAALRQIPEDYPYRGPKLFEQGGYRYENIWNGEVDRFSGEEFITFKGNEVYRTKYMGGLIDKRK